MPSPSLPKFYLGSITILQNAEAALKATGQTASAFLYEHAYNTPEEAIDEDEAVVNQYSLPGGQVLIIITDSIRTQTVIMTPQDRPPS